MSESIEDLWERRYRDLEQQFEHLLLNVAKSMQELEQKNQAGSTVRVPAASTEPKILKIVKTSNLESSYVYCVANGNNMEFRFELFANKEIVQDSGFTRLNSAAIEVENVGVADTCRVSVKADANGKRRELSAHSKLTWGKN